MKMLQGNVLLVSKNHFMRQGLVQALSKDTLSVAGEEFSAEAAFALLQSGNQHVDVIVFDADSAGEGADLKPIADQYPQISIVVLTAEPGSFAYEQAAEIRV